MKRRWSLLFVWMVAFGSVLDSLPAHAAPPSFTISGDERHAAVQRRRFHSVRADLGRWLCRHCRCVVP